MLRGFAAIAVAATMFAAPVLGTPAAAADLKAAIFAPDLDSPFRVAFDKFVNYVNEHGANDVRIATVLGPEAVPQNQQPRALKDGLVDMIAVPPSYIENLVPGLGGLSAARITTQQMRQNGTFDLVNEYLAKLANARMIGLYAGDIPFYIFTNKEVKGLADFKGLRLRVTNTVKDFFAALGAQPLQIGRGEIYTALERGVVNGYSNINSELFTAGWIEVIKYRVGPGFYAPNIAIFMNLDKYNALSPQQRKVLEDGGVFVEGEPSREMQRFEEQELARAVKEKGLKVIEFSKEDSEKFLQLAYDAQWDAIVKKAPDLGPKLREKLIGN